MKFGFTVMADIDEIGFFSHAEALGYDSVWVADSQMLFSVPGPRVMGYVEHRVPLSDAALNLLRTRRPSDAKPGDLVFPNPHGRKLSHSAMSNVLERMGYAHVTGHGFRSTFSTWRGEATDYPREIAEAALAHKNADKVEAAYLRSDFIDKRRRMMADWAAHCGQILPATGDVVSLTGRRRHAAQA